MTFLCTAVLDDLACTTAKTDLEYAIVDMRDQINEHHNCDPFCFDTINSDYSIETDPYEHQNQIEYVQKCLEELWKAYQTSDDDVWIIADHADLYGYGAGNIPWTAPDGQKLWGARVLHTPSHPKFSDSVELFWNLAIHAEALSFGATHTDGGYEVNSSGTASGVTPMATGYVNILNDWNRVDTCYRRSVFPPPDFACGPSNGSGSQWCGNCDDTCRHDISMTTCTLNKIHHKHTP